jgi:hypothetical protein
VFYIADILTQGVIFCTKTLTVTENGNITKTPLSHSTRGHPGVSTPPSQISIKFGIQHLWTNITTCVFYFLHIGSHSVF